MNEVIQSNINIVEVINNSTKEIIPLLISSPNIELELKVSISKVFKLLANVIDLLPEINKNDLNNNYKKLLEKSIINLNKSINKLPECPNSLKEEWTEYNLRWNNYINFINCNLLIIDFPLSIN